jgi:hypothetical protein
MYDVKSLKPGMILAAPAPVSERLFIIKKILKDAIILDHHLAMTKESAFGLRYEIIFDQRVELKDWENKNLIFGSVKIATRENYHFFVRAMWERPIKLTYD